MGWQNAEEQNTWRTITTDILEKNIKRYSVGLLNMRDGDDWTDLHKAAWCCPDPNVIRCLIHYGWNMHARTTDNNTPLHFAARYNPEPQVTIVLANVNANGVVQNADARLENADEETPYNCAQQNENLAETEILVALRNACN